MSLCMGAGVMYTPVACVCLLCIQMSTLCEQLVTLASNGLSQSTDISPEAATSAVTTLVEENTHLKEDIERCLNNYSRFDSCHLELCVS